MLYCNKPFQIIRKEFKRGGFIKGITLGHSKVRGANQVFLPVPPQIFSKLNTINGFNKQYSIGRSKKGYPKIIISSDTDKNIYLILSSNLVAEPLHEGKIEILMNNEFLAVPEDKIIGYGIGKSIDEINYRKIKYQELAIKAQKGDIYKVTWTDDVEPYYYSVNEQSVVEIIESEFDSYYRKKEQNL